jgi:hypothetical protein
MRKTIITVLGDLTDDEYVRLSRAAQSSGLTLQVANGHAIIAQAGNGHAPNPFVDPTPLAIALRRAVQRSTIAITAESDPGNGRDVSGALLCKSPRKIDGKRDFTMISYRIDKKNGKYKDVGDVVAKRIEALRAQPTTIEKTPLMDWLTLAMVAVEAGKTSLAPLILTPEMRVDNAEPEPEPVEQREHSEPEFEEGLMESAEDAELSDPTVACMSA